MCVHHLCAASLPVASPSGRIPFPWQLGFTFEAWTQLLEERREREEEEERARERKMKQFLMRLRNKYVLQCFEGARALAVACARRCGAWGGGRIPVMLSSALLSSATAECWRHAPDVTSCPIAPR